ncbi:MAG: acetyltransferase [Cytophagales bacterium CG12_big_fil_rev_8_21_14_0_65_40_12]|nr:MAG: acetyltransferase [Cytophagales bacterium CG12_big_fil_rev_8_21_14_0_65_40_12]PIW05544.1 MAG: acetyltransferase [Cytophagales bacterium CG17_big_fil_post_rev_8_21_14_2_50_40_13]
MILIGASGHSKVIIDILRLNNIELDNLVDANPSIKELQGIPVLLEDSFEFLDQEAIIAIGSNAIRKRLALKHHLKYVKAIHPKAVLDSSVQIGLGTVVMASATINSDTKIGDHCIINTSASIDHDCSLGDFVHISPNATLCGGVQIGEGTQVGANAAVIPNITIGKWVTIGAGAVVISNIPDFAVVVGNPARIIKYNND